MIVGLRRATGEGASVALSLLLAGFIFYMVVDSVRTAKAKMTGQVSPDPLESWSKNRPVGPIILIVLGAIFLLNNFNWFPFSRLVRFWGLILIIDGGLRCRNRLRWRV